VALLKNADRAVIDTRKLADYALNPDNPVGLHKARVFAAVLGFDRSNLHLLIEELRRGVVAQAAEPGLVDEHSARYRVDMWVTGPKGTATIRMAWIYRAGSDCPGTRHAPRFAEPGLSVGQAVYLREPVARFGLARGAVVMVFTRPRLASEVEFVDEDGKTRALATLRPEQVSAA
jgi:hypothetical protein